MLHIRHLIPAVSLVLWSCSATKPLAEPKIENGVSLTLAKYRKSNISQIHYQLALDIPRAKGEAIHADERLSFQLKNNTAPLQLDFREDPSKIKQVTVNGQQVATRHESEHLIIESKYLKKGRNDLTVVFQAGEAALNRNADYLYTLFVPDRARTVFPCFDQPDLKAVYSLTLKIPADWSAIANASLVDSTVAAGRKALHFDTSDTISTYLFSFVAGKFAAATGNVGEGLDARFLYRETDTAKLRHSMSEIFKLHKDALSYLTDWTAIPYPFQKFDFAGIPDFQFGGMEHVGAIQYKASALFLDGGATKDQYNSRSNLIAHETAHMWFGDLVTMNWFTDVWMKEVFANFMADKSMEALTGKAAFDHKFLIDHVPAAYGIDRTIGSNPIRQDLDNLKDAGSMYGNIIYHKAPIMMRQLERLMGKEKFQTGVREYLRKFANGNASWPELIRILDKHADADLEQWNKVWVNDTGRPVLDYELKSKGGKISSFEILQRPEYGSGKVWPQIVEVTLYYPGYSKELTVNLDAAKSVVIAAQGMDVPSFVLFNSSGYGYGVWPIDPALPAKLYDIEQPLERASAYISLYENMLNGRYVKPEALLKIFIAGLSREQEELNLKLISGYAGTIFWEFLKPELRKTTAPELENALWTAMMQNQSANQKKLLFKAYQDIFLSGEAKDQLFKIWKSQQAPAGLKLSEDDYTSLAFSLALRDVDAGLLKEQLGRISNADRKSRFEFIIPAVSSDGAERDRFFQGLELKTNRAKEANVVAALAYLHHPLRQERSINYLAKSLDLLTEIQTTGDIFFPQNWLQATFGYYQQAEAVKVVDEFLKNHPDYNPKLRAKILQAVDYLYRAQRINRN